MKIRSSFVTNSSSSSFIVAMKDGATIDDLRAEIAKQSDIIKGCIDDCDDSIAVNRCIDEMAERLNNVIQYCGGVSIDAWKVGADTFYSDNDTIDYAIYCLNPINTDKIKVQGV